MLNLLKKWFGQKKCFICKQAATQPTFYQNDQGEEVAVCFHCVPYAERRALKKVR